MTTPTPDDPYTNRPAQDRAEYPQGDLTPPPPLPGHTPPPGEFVPSGWAPQRPSGLATAAIVLTGLYTLTSVISAATAQSSVDEAKEALATGEASTNVVGGALQFLSGAIAIAAFVVLALWMTRIRSNLAKRGITAGGPPAVEWWGWFVPLANFVLPFLGMKAIAHKKVSIGVLLGWWIPFCLTWVVSFAATIVSFTAIDLETGLLSDPGALDSTVQLTYLSAIFVVVSWAFLFTTIRRVTANHLDD